MFQVGFPIALKLFAKTFLIGSINRVWRHMPIQKPSQNTQKPNFYRQPIQEPIFFRI
jgi:hypothetical protein